MTTCARRLHLLHPLIVADVGAPRWSSGRPGRKRSLSRRPAQREARSRPGAAESGR